MVNKSRSDIYNYLYNMFFGTVTDNVYSMNEPQELEDTDRTDGFIVLRVGDIHDESEFDGHTYGWVRCYVEAFVPPITRGRVDIEKYREFEEAIDAAIQLAIESTAQEDEYYIQEDSVLSSDADETSNANNSFFVFIKSFIVTIDKQE